mgnify:CR=1 FL=1
MDNLRYVKDPKEFSYSDFCEIVHAAYVDSVKKFNIDSSTGMATPQKLEELVDTKQGVVFAAYDNDRLVGGALLIRYGQNRWYCKGEACETKYLSVHPSYQRRGIAKHLKSMIFDYVYENGYKCIISTINANNKASIQLQLSDGYLVVDTYKGYHNHRTVKLIKWFVEPPYSNRYRQLRYGLRFFVAFINTK